MFNGTIVRAAQHFRAGGKTFALREIPWKPWGRNSPWQYCTSKNFTGHCGGWLMNKVGSEHSFYLSEQPNNAAFEQMENFTTRPRHTTAQKQKCDICNRSFRGEAKQNTCAECLKAEIEKMRSEKIRFEKQAKEAEMRILAVTEKSISLKRKYEEISDSANILSADLSDTKISLQKSAEKVVLVSNKMNKALDVERRTAQVLHQFERRTAQVLQQFSEVTRNVLSTSVQLAKLERSFVGLETEKDDLRIGIDDVKWQITNLPKMAVPSHSWFVEQICEDIEYMFKHVFGGQCPNRNVSLQHIDNKIREWPPLCHRFLLQSGIKFQDEYTPLVTFCKQFDALLPGCGDKLACYYNFGNYLNILQEEVSLGHMAYRDLCDVVAQLPEAHKLTEETLYAWKRISLRHCKSKILEHLFQIRWKPLVKYKYIKGVKLYLKRTRKSYEMWIGYNTRSFRQMNRRWEEMNGNDNHQ